MPSAASPLEFYYVAQAINLSFVLRSFALSRSQRSTIWLHCFNLLLTFMPRPESELYLPINVPPTPFTSTATPVTFFMTF